MLAQICQFLAVDSSNFPINEHIIVGDRSNEGGFLIHYFLNLCQKQNRPVVFVGLSQSFNHYNTVAQKLGTNLLFARDENKNLVFIEGLKLLSECVSPTDCEISEYQPFLDLLKGNSAPLLELIRQSVDKLTKPESPQSPVIIIDDLAILLSAGVSARDLILFVSSLHDFVTSNAEGSVIVCSHIEKEDEEAEEIWAFMSHQSSLKIEVSDLKSGYCKDVHGQMKIQWCDTSLKPRKALTNQTQFKLSDKTIDLFASGMSSAVL